MTNIKLSQFTIIKTNFTKNISWIKADLRKYEDCERATKGIEIVSVCCNNFRTIIF